MPIRGTRYPFTLEGLRNAPPTTGVYCLWDGEELIYIGHTAGRTATILSLLTDHWFGVFGGCTQKATHFAFEVCPGRHITREAELLEERQRVVGHVPRCHRVRHYAQGASRRDVD